MSLTRKMLKAMGIEEEKIDQIIEAHGETVDALKEERNSYKTDAEKLSDVQKELNDAKDKLAKNGEGETVPKEDYDNLKKQYDDYKNDVTTKETLRTKKEAYRELAKSLGLSDRGVEKAVKYADFESIELDKDGKIKNADAHSESVKAEWGDFIETTATRGANTATPPANTGSSKMTKAEIYKKDDHGRYILSAEERQKALAETINQ